MRPPNIARSRKLTIGDDTRLSNAAGSASVRYLDNHVLVVSKPAGQLTQADRTGDMDLLTEAKQFVKRVFDKPGEVFLGLVHRLDRPASGLVVLARTSKAAERLSRQFRERTVSKHYLALVEGRLTGNGTCEGYIAKVNERPELTNADAPGAKFAKLFWRSRAVDDSRSLMHVELETGRPHQIRLQVSDMGHPIVGDMRYGAKTELDGKNLALHAHRLEFTHPTTRELLSFMDLPAHWNGVDAEAIARFVQSQSA